MVFLLFGVPWVYNYGAARQARYDLEQQKLPAADRTPADLRIITASDVSLLGKFVALAVVAISLDLVWGYTGVLCLCQSLFFTLGGYAMGMYLAMHGPLDGDEHNIPRALFVVSSKVSGMTLPWFWHPFGSLTWGVLLGLMVPGLLALVVGYFGFASRVRGVYFAILTQALTLAAYKVFCLNNMLLCGTNGLTNFVSIAGFDLHDNNVKVRLFQCTVLIFIGAYLFCRYIVNSRMGRVLIAIRDNESRLRFSGYRPHYFKLFVFTLSAMLAGLGGILFVPQNGIITPSNMAVKPSIDVAIWVAVGGRGKLAAPPAGADRAVVRKFADHALPEFLAVRQRLLVRRGGAVVSRRNAQPDWRIVLRLVAGDAGRLERENMGHRSDRPCLDGAVRSGLLELLDCVGRTRCRSGLARAIPIGSTNRSRRCGRQSWARKVCRRSNRQSNRPRRPQPMPQRKPILRILRRTKARPRRATRSNNASAASR